MRKFVMSCAACAVALTAGVAAAEDVSNEDEVTGYDDPINERHVDIRGGVFFPPLILASVGQTITVKNQEDEIHDVTAIDDSWSSGPIAPGEEKEVTLLAEMTLCFKSTFNENYKGGFGSPETGEAPECYELSGDGNGDEVAE
ncbi:hypothetical protein [uncultured Litoreibacter sp.]|uniref:hypothetical protein n=1 Tax=uncultured Litoreibacter sp. TaxID=1392394 RepID=UPI00261A0E84|nr:hypothetical protein [uncultured Litoreibacter sp.]